MTAEVDILIKATDQASAAIKGSTSAVDSLEKAVQKLAQQDFAKRQAEAARITYEKMSEAEKLATLATANYQDQLAQVAREQEKAANAAKKTADAAEEHKSKLAGLASGLNDVATELTGFNLAQLSVVGGVVAVGNAVKGAVTDWVSYAEAMEKLSGVTGTGIEDTSRLVQVADDLRISQEAVERAMGMAVQNGFLPTIENLAVLSDRYLAIQDPAQRAAEMQDIFGKSWRDMVPLLQQGGQALRDSAAAMDDAMVVTEAEAEQARAAAKALDDWNDSLTAIKNTIAVGVLPPLTNFFNTLQRAQQITEESNTGWMRAVPILGSFQAAIVGIKAAFTGEEPEVKQAAQATDKFTEEVAQSDKVTRSASWVMDQYRASVDTTAQATDEIRNKTLAYEEQLKQQADLQKQVAEAQDNVTKAEQNWQTSAGGQMAGMLEQNRLGWEKYREGLGIIDKVMNTNLGTEADQKRAMEDLAKKYNSGKISQAQFELGLQSIKENFQDTSSQVEIAKQKLAELEARLTSLNNKVVTITVKVDDYSGGGGGGGGAGTNCFVYDTPVNTPDGFKRIGEIRAGDIVLVKQQNGDVVQAAVKDTLMDTRSDIVEVATSDGQVFRCSPNHKWWTKNAAWTWAAHLLPGDELVTANDQPAQVVSVTPYPGKIQIYNIHVSHPEHTFLVGGFVVHNAQVAKATGGPVRGGMPYLIGEIGPEMFVPPQNGRILSHSDAMQAVRDGVGGGGGGGDNYTFYISGSKYDADAIADAVMIRIGKKVNKTYRSGAGRAGA